MRNYWTCSRDYFGGWSIEFPQFNNLDQIINLTNFMSRILAIGSKEKILSVRSSSYLQQLGVPNLPYIEQIEWLIINKQVLEFFTYFNIRDTNKTGLISYYKEDGSVLDEEVGDMWELLKRLHPNEYDLSRPARVSPIDIMGVGNIPTDKNIGLERGIGAQIYLFTDIWFPSLKRVSDASVKEFDNSELAYRHTPRLNNFLTSVRDITLQWGGHWRVMSPSVQESAHYKAQLTEIGIKLP